MDGWTVTRGEGGGRRQEEGVRGGGEDGWGKMLLWGGVSYPRPMAAPLLRWMKAPRPAVVAVTNLLRFSARLEARGRGSPSRPHHHQHHPTASTTRPPASPHVSLNTHNVSIPTSRDHNYDPNQGFYEETFLFCIFILQRNSRKHETALWYQINWKLWGLVGGEHSYQPGN